MKLTDYEVDEFKRLLDKIDAVVAVANSNSPEFVDVKLEVVSSKSHCLVAVPATMLSRLSSAGRALLSQQGEQG